MGIEAKGSWRHEPRREMRGGFWQQDNHPIECSTEEILETRMNYLHENPVRAGFVWRAEDYQHSSAIDYYTTGKGLINIAR